MRSIHHGPKAATLALSVTNLRALLAKAEDHPPNSHGTISRVSENGVYLTVIVEPDDVHYLADGRDGVRGVMDPDTESFLAVPS
jgi:hypothetical protein